MNEGAQIFGGIGDPTPDFYPGFPEGTGKGGDVNVTVHDTLSISGASTTIEGSSSGIFSSSQIGQGKAGDISISATRLNLTDGGVIEAETGQKIGDFPRSTGRGGNLTIDAKDIELSNGGEISAESFWTGESGRIFIKAFDNLRLVNGGKISVATTQANAGDIELDVGFLLHLRDQSSITTSVAGGQGDGGNITIDPVFTVLDGGSSIIARAREGRGGNIRIVSDFLFASPDSLIDASSELGVSGAVDIESPESDVVSGALALPESFLDAVSLLRDRCTARAIKGASSFIVSGRGGVPPGPETVLPSFPELGLSEAPKAKGSASVSEHALAQGTSPVECAIE
ncbi:MAG: hypothetical protein ACREV3_11080 [Gammaproteobacteria bacterium]